MTIEEELKDERESHEETLQSLNSLCAHIGAQGVWSCPLNGPEWPEIIEDAKRIVTERLEAQAKAEEVITPRKIESAPTDGTFVLVWLPTAKVWAAGEFQEGIGFNGHYNGDDPWEKPEWWIPMIPSPNIDERNAE